MTHSYLLYTCLLHYIRHPVFFGKADFATLGVLSWCLAHCSISNMQLARGVTFDKRLTIL